MNQYESPSVRLARGAPLDTVNAVAQRLPTRPSLQSRSSSSAPGRSYFDMRPKPAAPSPTSTLVADLSQNFHLGASPAVPTPRRSLMRQFSCNGIEQFGLTYKSPTTPTDELRLSPSEMMETSPISVGPRKTLTRTTSMIEGPCRSNINKDIPQALAPRQLLQQRPQLLHRKAFSSYRLPEKKPFSFGKVALTNDKENDLADQFKDSPKKTPRKFFGMDTIFKRNDLSSPPMPAETERSPLASLPINSARPLPVFRRTQSMIGCNDEFLQVELATHQQTPELYHRHTTGQSFLPTSPEIGIPECQLLPSFESKNDRMRRISGQTFANVLDGHYQAAYDALTIIDCRFEHEFNGGHIPGAINISSLEDMDRNSLLSAPCEQRSLIILHCEHSEHRAPRIALHLRNRDRRLNSHRYPQLYYPEVYILSGGYQQFHREFRAYLGTSGYVAMNDPTFKPCATKKMHEFRKHTKLQRTQSYTYGQDVDSPLSAIPMQREISVRGDYHEATAMTDNDHLQASDDTDTSMMDVDDSYEVPSAHIPTAGSIFGQPPATRHVPSRVTSF